MEILKEFGLTEREEKVYLALLQLGSTTTGPIIKKSGVPNSKIYEVLESLQNKSFVSWIIKGKIKYFQASDPEIIVSLVKDRERRILEELPKLKGMQELSKNKQQVELYEGMKAITNLYVNLIENLKKGDEWRSFSLGENEFSEKAQIFWNKIGDLRAQKKLKVRIMNNVKYKKDYQIFYKDRWKFIKKIIRFSKTIFPATTTIVGGKIIIINFLAETATAVVIASKDLYNHYREFHIKEWELAEKV